MLANYSFNFNVKPINDEGIIGSFGLGVLTSVAWVPCYSAYLMSLISLLVTSANPMFVSFNIVLYCLGLGLTLLALSFAISKVDIESLINRTSIIPKVFAVLIIIGAIYLLI
jgi:cytochrome c biogenesis protein CcdA